MATGDDWSREEVEAIVADDLSMLENELAGQRFSKTEHRRTLAPSLSGRSEGSVEFKHCNISAVMLELGFPYVKGYQPRANFQRSLLPTVVVDQIRQRRVLDHAAQAAVELPAVTPMTTDFARVKAEPPKLDLNAKEDPARYDVARRDYLEREARNRSLGQAGEEFALRFERWRLIETGARALAERVEHVSMSRGDGLGYDILSFEPDGRERFVEVKTTSFGQATPFFVSANEARFARDHAPEFRLYRIYDFRAGPRLFELRGAVEQHCRLDPVSFKASFG